MTSKITVQPDQLVTQGYGEYIVYHEGNNGQVVEPSRETYEFAYSVLSHYNSPEIYNRHQTIAQKIKRIDPSLRVTFIPRTYYELQLIKKAIKEDLARNEYCPNELNRPNPYLPNNIKDCWHISHFPKEEDSNAEAVRVLAFNLNQNLVKKLRKCPRENSSLKFGTIANLCEKQIHFFRNFANRNIHQLGGFKGSPFASVVYKFNNAGMSIGTDQDAQIVRNAEALECSKIAEKAHLLYRGTDFPTDLPYSPNNDQQPYSFSFGAGLFAGAYYREGATPYLYIKESKHGYAMAVPAEDLPHGIFFIPKQHSICQLTSENGVIFHPRTHVWKTNLVVYGFDGFGSDKRTVEPFFSILDRESLTDEVFNYKNNNVVFLKSDKANSVMTTPPAFQPTIHIYYKAPPGTSLFLRGNDQAGLTWGNGQPMIQIDDTHWIYRLSGPFKGLEFKVLIDDKVWAEGHNYKLEESETEPSETPTFRISPQPSPGKATRLTVKYNAGHGNNTLMICGSGAGLNWNMATPLKKLGDDLWIWETFEPFESIEYKLLINGKWESGPNHRIKHGKKLEIIPRF